MNKKSIIITLTLFVIILSGCDEFADEKSFYSFNVPQERLQNIDTFEIEKMTVEEKPSQEPNEIAPSKMEISLEVSRAHALTNNLELKVQLLNPAIAAESVGIEEAKFESAFTSSLSYTKTDSPSASRLSGTKIESGSMNYGVEMPLRTGGTVNFNLAENRTKNIVDFEFDNFNPSYTSDFSISISQPLLRNAGKRVNTHSIRIADYNRMITDARTKLEVIRVIASVDRVYWRLYAARKELEVRKKEYDLANAQLERAKNFVEAGEMAQVEVIRAEAGVAQRLENIIIAETNVRNRQRELKRVLNIPNIPMNTSTIMIATSEPDPVHYEFNNDKLISEAIVNRMEMLELEFQIAQDISTIDYNKNQLLPLVTAEYTYNINGLGETRDDAYDLLYDKNFEDQRLGLQVVIPLGNQVARSRLRQSIFQRSQRIASKEDQKSLIQYEVLNAVDQLEANWQRILASRQSAILDGRLYEAELRQFEVGLRTSTDVLEAQANLANSKSAEIQAITEYQIALVDLAYATGTLLGSAKIRWEPIIPETTIK